LSVAEAPLDSFPWVSALPTISLDTTPTVAPITLVLVITFPAIIDALSATLTPATFVLAISRYGARLLTIAA